MIKGNLSELIIAIIGSGIINVILTNIWYEKKLEKESAAEKNSIMSRKIEDALFHIWNVELLIKTQDILEAEDIFASKGSKVDLFDGECIYPSILNDWNSLNEFREKINECREKYEKYVSNEVALNLVYIERYLMQLSLYLAENYQENDFPYIGSILIFDLRQWQTKMDILLVNEINKTNLQLESHESDEWEKLGKDIIENQFNSSILHYLIYGDSALNSDILEMLENLFIIQKNGVRVLNKK